MEAQINLSSGETLKVVNDGEFPNGEAFENVCERLEGGEPFSLSMVGEIFGQSFWDVLIGGIMDVQGAATDAIIEALEHLRDQKEAETNG